MKKSKIQEWINKHPQYKVSLHRINIPEDQQGGKWWIGIFGTIPSTSIAPGKYYFYYASRIDNDELGYDAQIEVCNADNMFGYDYVNLIRIEED